MLYHISSVSYSANTFQLGPRLNNLGQINQHNDFDVDK